MTAIEFIRCVLETAPQNIKNTLLLLEEGCTIPFIARYRKDQTGNLDEVAIEKIAKQKALYETIVKRKQAVLTAIEEQGKLGDELREKIEKCYDLTEIEDLYLPFKKKRKTKADQARENGLEPLAKILMAQNASDMESIALKYLNEAVTDVSAALRGAREIIAEWINENMYIRRELRKVLHRQGQLKTKVVREKATEEEARKYEQYFDWSEPVHRIAAHRLLAILRAEKEGFIRFVIEVDREEILRFIEKSVIKSQGECAVEIQKAIADSYKRLLEPALVNEVLQNAKRKADESSIAVFASNLSQLLLAPPLGEKRVLAIDPGYKTGCKVVCLDENGNLLYNETIYPHPPQKEAGMAMKKIRSMVNSYKVEAIAIGNGTASRETEFFIKKIAFDRPVQVFVVNEAGASVYSASKIAREEFPNYDVTVRGAVSIGRRLVDPLAELVKIDPKSIGVGQYQHDVDQKLLKEELDNVVMRSVNAVGINLNTASKALLSYVSGIGEKMAANIVQYRLDHGTFTSRAQLKNVPRLGDKAFQQAAAFVRIVDAENPLDNSAVHPEAYPIVEKMAKDLKISVTALIGNQEKIARIDLQKYVTDIVGEWTLKDILKELEKPGLDPRKTVKIFEFAKEVKSIDDLSVGQIVPGIVNNITNFGCFVDIGIKESGLVHISQLKKAFVSDVNEVVRLHQHVEVKVLEVDKAKKRIQLSMILE